MIMVLKTVPLTATYSLSAIWVADVTSFCDVLAIGVTVFIAFCVV